MKTPNWYHWTTLTMMGAALFAAGCGSASSSSSTEDSSTSGTVASMMGGTVQSAQGSGSLGFYNEPRLNRPMQWADFLKQGLGINDAWAATPCPTLASSNTSGGGANTCQNGSGNVTMTYSSCSFNGSSASWTGSQVISATGIGCGSTTFFKSLSGSVSRTFGSGTVRTAASGTQVAVDTSGSLVLTIGGSAGVSADGTSHTGGTSLSLTSGAPQTITVNGISYVGTGASGNKLFSHTLYTSQNLTPDASGAWSGTVNVVHNYVKILASSKISGLTFTSGCCQPTGGTITTTFSALTGASAANQSKYVGATETLTFSSSCGQASYTGPEGGTGTVTLAHCL